MGSGTAVTSAILLQAFGVPTDAVRQQALSFLDATAALIRGELDAVFIAAADPVTAVRRATEAGAVLLAAMAGSVRGVVAVLVIGVLLASPIAVLALGLAGGLAYLYLKR